MEKNHPTQWDLTNAEVRSHLHEMNSFSYKRFVFMKWNSPLCWNISLWLYIPLQWDVSLNINSLWICLSNWYNKFECLRSIFCSICFLWPNSTEKYPSHSGAVLINVARCHYTCDFDSQLLSIEATVNKCSSK